MLCCASCVVLGRTFYELWLEPLQLNRIALSIRLAPASTLCVFRISSETGIRAVMYQWVAVASLLGQSVAIKCQIGLAERALRSRCEMSAPVRPCIGSGCVCWVCASSAASLPIVASFNSKMGGSVSCARDRGVVLSGLWCTKVLVCPSVAHVRAGSA